MFPVTAYADTAVASIGDNTYSTLSEAITAATEGAEITLLQDTAESITVASGKKITLDLGKHTLTGRIYNQGTLTLENGTVSYERNAMGMTATIENSGTLVVDGCTVNCTGNQGKNGIYNTGTGNVTIRNTEVNAKMPLQNKGTNSVMTIESGNFTSTSTAKTGEAFENKGTAYVGKIGGTADSVIFTATGNIYGIDNAEGTMYVYAATISAYKGIVNGENGELYIGDANNRNVNVVITADGYSDAYAIDNAGTATVYGGSYTGVSAFHNYSGATAYIYGGTFKNKKQSEGDTEGVYGIHNEGTMTIGEENASNSLITINSTVKKRHCVYNNGSSAKLTVNSGTISLTSSSQTNVYGINNVSSASLTVNGGAISASAAGGRGINNDSSSTVTINGGNISGVAAGVYNQGTMTVGKENASNSYVKIETTSENSACCSVNNNGDSAKLTINSGTILSPNKGIINAKGTVEIKNVRVENAATALSATSGTIKASGGEYSSEPASSYIAAGYSVVKQDDEIVPYIIGKGATITLTDPKNTDYSEEATVLLNTDKISEITAPTRAGYIFGGWTTEKDGDTLVIDASGKLVANVSGYTDADGNWTEDSNTTLYASWTEDPRTITFNGNGGDGTMDSQTVLNGVETALNANAFTKEGYGFIGWAITADGDVTYVDKAAVTFTENTELYAVWKLLPVFTVTEIAEGKVGDEYRLELIATGDDIVWSIKEGTSLPEGLTLDGNVISGTPTEAGTFTFTVVATNEGGAVEQEISITVKAKEQAGGNNRPGKNDNFINNSDKEDNNKQDDETNPSTGADVFAVSGNFGFILLAISAVLFAGKKLSTKNAK